MATNTTFDSLQTDIRNYLERGGSGITDPTVFEQIPREINGAEADLMTALRLQGELEVLVDAASGLGIGQSVIPKPDRWRVTVSINFGAGAQKNQRTPLYPRSYEYCRSYWPDSTVTSVPRFYADYNINNWLVVPTPDQNYPAEFLLYMQPVLLDEGNQENFFTIFCGSALLYRTLLRMTPFLKNDDRIPVWKNLFEEQLVWLGTQDLQRILDRSAQRERP